MLPDKEVRPGGETGATPKVIAATTATVDHIADGLAAIHAAVTILGAEVIEAQDISAYAVELAATGWEVFPLRGKVPAIPNPHPKGSTERLTCKGECGREGHGVLDASSDLFVVTGWWTRYPSANIGLRLPENVMVIDIDPRSGGEATLTLLEERHGRLPNTLTAFSGRGDGGRHLYFRKPFGKLTSRAFVRTGIDLKTRSGYTVAPPSVHPDTGRPYRWKHAPIAEPPRWLVDIVRPPAAEPKAAPKPTSVFTGPLIADSFTESTTWAQVLGPHGWRVGSGDGEADGSVWLHPAHTSSCSATIRHGQLFTYSTNTPFEVTEPGNPRGYTRFRAHAVLNHGGDLRAAARALKSTGVF